MTILEFGAAWRARRISAREWTDVCLERIEQLNPRCNAFVTLTAQAARARAGEMDRELAAGIDRGPLHGVPVAVKDVFCTRGVRTTAGSRLFEDQVPDRDAAVVERLERAGAVLLGKTGMHELAYGITSNNPWFGTVRNPWDLERIPGGSSGGSGAAVAAGMVGAAMGTDTGGSIRIPASFCGTVGIKPTSGRVSRYGVLPLDFSLDHMGPLTRTVRDAAVVLEAIAGYDPRDDTSSPEPVPGLLPPENPEIAGLRVGIPENWFFERLSPEVETAVRRMARVAEGLGARLVPVSGPDFAEINAVARVILLAEAAAVMHNYMDRRDAFGADVLALLDQGRLLAATDYINAQRLRRMLCRDFRRVWTEADVLLVPATPTPAPLIGQTTLEFGSVTEDVRLATTRLVRGFNLLGVPALAMPCGFSSQGLPLGMQIVGPPFEEGRILRVGAALEGATDLQRRRPGLVESQ